MIRKIGWIGTGVMGRSMSMHLLKAGYSVSVNTRTKDKAAELLENGARWCASPDEAAHDADAVVTMVGYPSDVQRVYLGPDGILQGARAGSLIIDMTTSEPALAARIHEEAGKKGIASLDAPVSGGDVGAREAKLAIMIGGDRPAYEAALPVFRCMGETIAYMGPAGSGQHTKMSNQILIASTMIGVVESLMYAVKAGLRMDAVIDVIGKGAASSWSINNLGRRIAAGNFDPGFFIRHFVKDMGIALSEAARMKLSLPGLALAHQFYMSAMAAGLENNGTQGLYKVFERMNSK